jgi:beta-lactam-binding protein with PASTA domain
MIEKLSLAAAVLAMVAGLFASPCHAVMYRFVVPDVRNMPPAQAEKTLKDKGYEVKIVEIPAANITQVGKVMKQDPVGEYIIIYDKWRWPITLSVATKGSFVPNTLAMTEAAAVDAVKKAGYTPKVEYYPEQIGGMVGKVKGSVPAPHLGLAPGGTVTLQVGKPGYAMPSLVGQYSQGAKQTIDQLNSIKSLKLKSTITQSKTTTAQQDDQKIYEQSPAPGTVLTVGSEIKLYAYQYVPPPPPKPVVNAMALMPPLVGRSEQEATAFLAKAGLKVSVKYIPASQQDQGRVTAQSVRAGTRTAGPVVLTVGRK